LQNKTHALCSLALREREKNASRPPRAAALGFSRVCNSDSAECPLLVVCDKSCNAAEKRGSRARRRAAHRKRSLQTKATTTATRSTLLIELLFAFTFRTHARAPGGGTGCGNSHAKTSRVRGRGRTRDLTHLAQGAAAAVGEVLGLMVRRGVCASHGRLRP
jgi:hypothetical protein